MNVRPLILVVDDDPDFVDALAMKLEANDFRIAKAYDGNQAWDQLKQEKPDLVLLDVIMPHKDGYALCREIKNDPHFNDVMVVLLTAVAERVQTSSYSHYDGKTTPADDYIAKPVDLDKLLEIIQENLRR